MTEAGMRAPRGAGIVAYLKGAFLFRWNLLLFAGGAAAAMLSPSPDIVLPLVAAAELAYLAGLTSIPRFRAAIDAKVHAQARGEVQAAKPPVQQTLADMLRGLEPPARQRFDHLRSRCLEMQRLAQGAGGNAGAAGRADELRIPALDRLLWFFVRLLYSQQALKRFLSSTDQAAMERRLEELKARLVKATEQKDERIARALADSVATTELRRDNYRQASGNAEFVAVELDRIEGKIHALTEMTVSHQDPNFISSQVDSVAESMAHTEQAMRELSQITGLPGELDTTPAILDADLSTVLER